MEPTTSPDIREHFGVSEEYYIIATSVSHDKENFEIRNSTLNHAKFLIYLLIERSTKTIDIYSNDLDAACYDDPLIRGALTKATTEKKVKIRAIVRDGSRMAEIFSSLTGVEVRKLNEGITDITLDNHFMVCDGLAYRLEAKHPEDMQFVKARANFNNPVIAKPLSKFFDDNLYPRSTTFECKQKTHNQSFHNAKSNRASSLEIGFPL